MWVATGVQAGLLLAFNFPEYAQALEAMIVEETRRFAPVEKGIAAARIFVESHPIEASVDADPPVRRFDRLGG